MTHSSIFHPSDKQKGQFNHIYRMFLNYTGVPKRCIHVNIPYYNVYTYFWDTLYVIDDRAASGRSYESESSVSIVSDYGLDDWGSIPDRGRGFSSSLCVQTGSGAHSASCLMGTGGPFPRGKARPGRDADHSPPSSAEVKKE
jgi:hypothetical protein